MSDALLTRIAEALEKLVHHATAERGTPPVPAEVVLAKKPGRPSKAAAEPAAPISAPLAAAPAAGTPSVQTPTPATTAQPAAAPAATPPAELVTQTANAIIDLANNYSRDAAVACMAKYGAQKVSQVKPGDLAALLADVTAAIAAEKAKKANDSLV